ncbi:transforming growth factor-beta-induced protein ig-h3 [Lingula anatina]|uniref:Transforming growth factor-beta-induced protein ig-h3 n=1 Tax=Lingula anatina TaxID=7574 RepID=A0A1S3JUP8_LINAN|nr:transforming growth factor-beta-induced protein ig-h3 [Lingula anatina]|eukprot:XP_013413814.1 transforming growth factor-beta-induced protein ig-h3 [Lingula anatina]
MACWSAVLTALVILTLTSEPGARGAKENSRFYWRPNFAMPWTRGDNVCAIQEVKGTRKQYFTECMIYKPKLVCEKPTFVRYRCCSGYEEVAGERGCTGVKTVENLKVTMMRSRLTTLLDYAKRASLDRTFETDGPFTIFAPVNQAFRNLPSDLKNQLSSGGQSSLILYHALDGRVKYNEFRNDQNFPTVLDKQKSIRVNRYSNGVVTVNCARIIMPNQEATNGVVHTIEKVIYPIPDKTIMDILLEDGRFGELVTALILTRRADLLRETGPFTLFAPTDAAFRNLPADIVSRVFDPDNTEALKNLLNYHVIKHNLCTAAIFTSCNLRTLEGSTVRLGCTSRDQMKVDNALVTSGDILASNGIIHAVDSVLLPNSAKDVTMLAQEINLRAFMEAAESTKYAAALRGSKSSFTIFAPSDEAFAAVSGTELNRWHFNPDLYLSILKYHIMEGKMSTKDFVSQRAYSSQSASQGGVAASATLRLNLNRNGWSMNSAKVTSTDNECGNGVIHVIDKVMIPPTMTVLEIIKGNIRLSTFWSMIQTVGIDIFANITVGGGSFTIFAPTNEAFSRLDTAFMERLLLNTKELEKIIKYHILNRGVYSCGIQGGLTYQFRTAMGEWLKLWRLQPEEKTVEGNKMVKEEEKIIVVNSNTTRVIDYDVQGTDGVVYTIDQVLRCQCPEIDYY